MPAEPSYEVVSPVGEPASGKDTGAGNFRIPPAPPISNFTGRKLGFVWTKFRNGDVLLRAFADLLAKRFEGMQFVNLPSGRTLGWGEYPDATFTDVVKESGVDAVIAAPGC